MPRYDQSSPSSEFVSTKAFTVDCEISNLSDGLAHEIGNFSIVSNIYLSDSAHYGVAVVQT